jgi:hypothetical protein
MIVDSTLLLDQVSHPWQGPQARLVTESFGASLEGCFDLHPILGRQPRFATTSASCPYAFHPMGLDRGSPPTDGLPMNTNFPRHVRLAPALLEQRRGLQTPGFQGFEIALHSPWVSHETTVHEKHQDVTILRATQ